MNKKLKEKTADKHCENVELYISDYLNMRSLEDLNRITKNSMHIFMLDWFIPNVATSGDIQRGFDTNEITRKLDGINYGICDGFYAQNTNLLNGIASVNQNINNEGRAIQTQLAQCCCDTQRAIDGVNYNNAMNTASINANTTAQTQKILDAICQNKIESLQSKVSQLELQNALCGVVRYPNGWTYNAGTSPFCNSGCNC